MDRKLSVLFLVAVFGFPAYIGAQSASGLIAPSRMIDWSSAGVQGGIPNRTSICTSLSPGASSSQISNAIASCPSGQVVYLNAGTYNLSAGITFGGNRNVTLRGAGPDKTFIVFSGGDACNGIGSNICIAGSNSWQGGPNNTANWTSGYSQGTSQITLDNTSNLKVGSLLILDQLDDSSDNGGVFVSGAAGVGSTEGGGSGRPGRSQQQIVTVTAINGNSVSIYPSLHMSNWSASKSPGAWWPNQAASGDGVEDISLDSTNSSESSAIVFNNAYDSWVKNVKSINPLNHHVWIYIGARITIEDSYFYSTQNELVAGSESYGVLPYESSDCLIENDIFQHISSPIVPSGESANVYAYNYSLDDYYPTAPGWFMASIQPHEPEEALGLFEGNEIDGFRGDAIHGTADFLTLFRNRIVGWASGMSQNTIAIGVESYHRYFNIIGNVLGEAGYHTQYQDLAPNGGNADKSIYVLGWSGNDGSTARNLPNDPLVISTMMRWGNYDTVTNTIHWDPSEVPSGLSQYANSVPSTQTLPASFFLSSKPSWWGTPWGTPPWPAIGPDVTGGPGPGGHSYDIPAKLCYDNTSKDSNGILNFNADNCYSSSPAPAPPTNLGVVAH